MKKLLTVLVAFVYFVPASIFLVVLHLMSQGSDESAGLSAFSVPFIFMLLVCVMVVINIAGAVSSVMRSKCLSFRAVMVFKLCLIPFYIVNFACWAFASTAVFHISLVIWPLIPFIIAYTYFTLLGTSIHIIANLFTLRKSKLITTKQFITHCVLQLIFVFDVIDSIYLAIKQKVRRTHNDQTA